MSSHSGRVWALVLLDEAGMSPSFMKARLRWLGDSYRLYLRDTSIIQQQHIEVLNKSSDDITRLVDCSTLPTVVPFEEDMGNYDTDPFVDWKFHVVPPPLNYINNFIGIWLIVTSRSFCRMKYFILYCWYQSPPPFSIILILDWWMVDCYIAMSSFYHNTSILLVFSCMLATHHGLSS